MKANSLKLWVVSTDVYISVISWHVERDFEGERMKERNRGKEGHRDRERGTEKGVGKGRWEDE